MNPEYSVEKLIENFKDSVFPVFEKAIEHIPEAQRKDVVAKLKQAIPEIEGEFPLESVQKIGLLKETKLQNMDEVWLEAIEEATSAMPELVMLAQNESHFKAREGDSIVISFGKLIKQIHRFFRKGAHSTSNAFRRMFKQTEKEFEEAKREVPFKNIIRLLLFRLKPEIVLWKQEQYRFISRVFEATQSWAYPEAGEVEESEPEPEPEATSFEGLVNNLLKTYDEEFKEEQKRLLESYQSLEGELTEILELVGTIELPASKFDDTILEKEKSAFTSGLSSNNAKWLELKDALSQRLELLLGLKHLEQGVKTEEHTFRDEIDHFYIEQIISGHKTLLEIIQEGMSVLKDSGSLSIEDLTNHCESIFDQASKAVQDSIIDPLHTSIEEKKLSTFLNNYIESVSEFSSSQPEQGIIIEDLNIEESKPVFDIKQIEWRRFVLRMINKHIATELNASLVEPESMLSLFIERYQEVVQIIETNLDIIDEVSKNEEEEPVSIALKSFERSITKIEEIEELIKEERASLPEKVASQNQLLIENLSALLIKQDVSEIKWAETQLKVKESAGDFGTKITVFWANFVDKADLGRRFLTRKYRQYDDVVRGFLGLKKPVSQTVENTNLATFLHETDQKFEKLPFIYRRLFDFKREIESGFFIQNPLYFDSCRKALELWKGGFPASINLIGEKGSGKSTLTRFLMEEVFREEKTYNLSFSKTFWEQSSILKEVAKMLGLKEPESPEELVNAIKKKRKGSVVVLENLQNCYLRNMNGYGAMKSLLYIISESKKEILWVVTCSRYAWNFLNVAFNVGDYFSYSITTDVLNADQMKSLILKRQKASGYQLEYIADASTLKSRAYKKYLDDKEAEQEFLENKYFEKLTNLAEGNATVAMILWIRSIKDIDEAYFTIESLDFMNTTSLDGLDTISQFALSAFILHDSLTALELASLLNQNESEAEMTVSRLAYRGLLVAKKDKYFALNDLVYRQVVRLLKSRNILH
ncbi:MAG: ATP-binding protein [Balneola sp.]